jgi:hypothetical protein
MPAAVGRGHAIVLRVKKDRPGNAVLIYNIDFIPYALASIRCRFRTLSSLRHDNHRRSVSSERWWTELDTVPKPRKENVVLSTLAEDH